MALLKLVEWKSDSRDTIVHRINFAKDYITKGSKLTVREGQAAVFCHKGKMADVFLPGMYTLDTGNIPFLTKLMGWKYGFESPFKSDIYFVNTRQFTGEKWGTKNPIIIRDADYGAVRVRAFGTYAFKVEDPFIFLTEISGAVSSFYSSEISEYLRSIVVTRISDIIGESKVPVLDMAGNLVEFGEEVKKGLNETFKPIGLTVSQFNFENFSLPEALEKALDESTSLGILGKNMNVYTQKAQADALINASKNPGTPGGIMGAGLGMSMGIGMGNMFMNNMNGMQANSQASAGGAQCSKCGAKMSASAKFCPDCGAPAGATCPKCGARVKPSAKFCAECGASLGSASCPNCGKAVKPGAKFCAECGSKL
ncbi:MAG: SPFH domain-containing protein [Clostridia bacterium]|nr:SPFH domain-containing protein [Clostridia bacterium]